MVNQTIIRLATVLATLNACAIFSPACAQGAPQDPAGSEVQNLPQIDNQIALIPPPSSDGAPGPISPERFTISPGGVDMRSGRYVYQHIDLSIGPPEGSPLTLVRGMPTGKNVPGGHTDRMGSFSHNWDIFLSERRIPVFGANNPSQYDFLMTVNFEGLGTSFRSRYNPMYYEQVSNDGRANLSFIGDPSTPMGAAIYTMIARDGTAIEFRPLTSYDCTNNLRCAYASKIVRPDGETILFSYDNDTLGSSASDRTRLISVISNRGYALLFNYGTITDLRPNKVCALNLAVTAKPADNVCPVGSMSAIYIYNGTFMTGATDMGGVYEAFSKGGGAPNYTLSYTIGGAPAPYLVNSVEEDAYGRQHIGFQRFSDGHTYDYTWHKNGNGPGDTDVNGGFYTDNVGGTVHVNFGWMRQVAVGITLPDQPETYQATDGPEEIIDALGRRWTADYCHISPSGCFIGRRYTQTDPVNRTTRFTYDQFRNVTETRMAAKPGSGLADIITSATYNCFYPITCNLPISVTDARGNSTSYVFSDVHGGKLSEVGPAVGGVSPAKKYSYTLRKAWIKNSSSGFVQLSTGVYLLTEERSCRTTALNLTTGACVGGTSDLVVTTYDYGPDTGVVGNNLWLRGKTVAAFDPSSSSIVSLRSCYGYDANGRKIWETSPRAGLAACY